MEGKWGNVLDFPLLTKHLVLLTHQVQETTSQQLNSDTIKNIGSQLLDPSVLDINNFMEMTSEILKGIIFTSPCVMS